MYKNRSTFLISLIFFAVNVFASQLNNLSYQDYKKINENMVSRGRTNLVLPQNKHNFKIAILKFEFQEDEITETSGNGKFRQNVDPIHDNVYFQDLAENLKNYYGKISNETIDIDYDIFPLGNNVTFTLPVEMQYYSNPDTIVRKYQEIPESDRDSLIEILRLANKSNISMTEYYDYLKPTKNYLSNLGITALLRDGLQEASLQDAANEINFGDYDLFYILHAGSDAATDLAGNSKYDIFSAIITQNDLIKYLNASSISVEGVNVSTGIIMPEETSQDGFYLGTTGVWARLFGSYLGLPSLNSSAGIPRIGIWGLMDYGTWNGQGWLPAEPCAWSKYYLSEKYNLDFLDLTEVTEDTTITISSIEDTYQMVKIPINKNEYYLIENRQRDGNGNGYFDVNDFDWLLPGSGLLIWHIDEERISETLEDNLVNEDLNDKGVDLEEADGIQDMDYESSSIAFTQNDPFYASNNSRFADDTNPNTKSKRKFYSGIEIYDISESGYEMSFKVRFNKKNSEKIYTNSEKIKAFYNEEEKLYFWDNTKVKKVVDGNVVAENTTNGFFPKDANIIYEEINRIVFPFENKLIAVDKVNLNTEVISQLESNIIDFSSNCGEYQFILADSTLHYFDENYNAQIERPFVYSDDLYIIKLVDGKIKLQDFYGEMSDILDVNGKKILDSKIINGQYIYLKTDEESIFLAMDDNMSLIKSSIVENKDSSISLELLDFDDDGIFEVMEFVGNKIYAYELNGVSLPDFPKTFNSDVAKQFVIGYNSNNEKLKVFFDAMGNFYILDSYNNIKYSAAFNVNNFFVYGYQNKVYYASGREIYAYNLDGNYDFYSSIKGINDYESVFFQEQLQGNFDKKTMNPFFYPNPAKEKLNLYGKALENDSKITLELYSLIGDKVFEETCTVEPMNYFDINIDISDFASGVYIGKVTMKSGIYKVKLAITK